jgi:hypothetical protein
MKYTIIVTQTEEKSIVESVYIPDDELIARGEGKSADNYRNVGVTKNIVSEIYRQSREADIDLKGIIDAFNADSK